MISFNDVELFVGQEVIICRPNYRGFVKGVISALTPQKVRVQYLNTWNHSEGHKLTTLVDPESVIVEYVQDGNP